MPRKIYVIAAEIRADWKNVNFAAEPYLQAMEGLETIDSRFGVHDSAHWALIRFAGNAASWRGAVARRIKKELKEMYK